MKIIGLELEKRMSPEIQLSAFRYKNGTVGMFCFEKSPCPYCVTHGTLLNIMWQPGWEGSVGEKGYG